MLLLIDAGNTRIKWALAEAGSAPGDWVASIMPRPAERARFSRLCSGSAVAGFELAGMYRSASSNKTTAWSSSFGLRWQKRRASDRN